MKLAVLSFVIALMACQPGFTQTGGKTGSMEIMATVVSSNSMDSVSVKISISSDHKESDLRLSPSDEEGATMIITGTPYESIKLEIPSEKNVANQYGVSATAKDFQLIYGNSENQTPMDVFSPGSCNELMIPETGQIYVKIGATVTSESELKGVYTGSVDFECSTE